jgi:nucleoside diphosphate kinase
MSLKVPGFFLMPEGENVKSIVIQFMTIKGYIARVAEGNDQLTELRKVLAGFAHIGRCFE